MSRPTDDVEWGFSNAKITEEMKAPRLAFLSPRQIVIVARLYLFLLSFLLPIAAFAFESSVQEQWKSFLMKPSASTYEPLSETIRMCVFTKCRDAAVAGSKDNFANFYKLLELSEHGNHYAMEIALQIRPLYAYSAAPGEDLNRSLGLSATVEPTFFLELMQKYNVPTGLLELLVVQTSIESIDSLRVHRAEWKRRIQSFSKVNEPRLLQLRDQAISLIQREIDKYSTLPDDAWGK
jgi:hypothetical protein